MKKTWIKLHVAGCIAALLATMPGMTVIADEMQEESVVSYADDVNETIDAAEESVTELMFADEAKDNVSEDDTALIESEFLVESIGELGDTESIVGANAFMLGKQRALNECKSDACE